LREPEQGRVPVLVPSSPGADSGGHSQANQPTDLARVVAAWPTLPDPIRTAILTLIRAVGGGDE
jgi:hypothetical protein